MGLLTRPVRINCLTVAKHRVVQICSRCCILMPCISTTAPHLGTLLFAPIPSIVETRTHSVCMVVLCCMFFYSYHDFHENVRWTYLDWTCTGLLTWWSPPPPWATFHLTLINHELRKIDIGVKLSALANIFSSFSFGTFLPLEDVRISFFLFAAALDSAQKAIRE